MPLPLALGATVPWWAPWLVGAAGSAGWIKQFQKGREEERGRRAKLTPYAERIRATPEWAERMSQREGGGKTGIERRQEAEAKRKGEEGKITPRKPATLEEANERLAMFEQMYGKGSYYLDYDDETGQYTVKRDPEFFKEKREESRGNKTPFGFNRYDNPETPEVEGGWTGTEWVPPYGWVSPSEQQTLSLQRQQLEEERAWRREEAQMQQQEQERQYRSQLMANPMSWLQYSSYAGETPAIQPWMQPLMWGQYKGQQAGQALPGWQSGSTPSSWQQGQQGGATGMSQLPSLLTPSAQYWARMGPTAQQQYMGYEQARTGQRPEETAFRLRASAPPSGRFGGLRRMR